MSDEDVFPIRIKVSKKFIDELHFCEEGSYEDELQRIRLGEDSERPLESHTHKLTTRSSTRLIIRNTAEADDVYYSVCSGTIQIWERGMLRTCQRVADILRPHARPETVRNWRYPTGF